MYTFGGYLKTLINFIYTKVFFGDQRLIRLPFYIRGKNKIKFGKNLTTGVGCRIDAFGKKDCLVLSDNIQINDYVHIASVLKVFIGKNVLIASKVFITDHNHGNYSKKEQWIDTIPALRPLNAKQVKIEENTWIGENAIILPGVTIGRCSVIGAGAVVTKSFGPYSIIGGNPAKELKNG